MPQAKRPSTTDLVYQDIGHGIRKRRGRRSQASVASAAGITARTVSRMELGEVHSFSADCIIGLCRALSCTPFELLAPLDEQAADLIAEWSP